jgi:hypothetical protein
VRQRPVQAQGHGPARPRHEEDLTGGSEGLAAIYEQLQGARTRSRPRHEEDLRSQEFAAVRWEG